MSTTIVFLHPHYDLTPRSALIISSIRVEEGPGHDELHIWNRGGKAGMLTVAKGDGKDLARKLLPHAVPYQWSDDD